MIKLISVLKKVPIDFNQREMGEHSKAKQIVFKLLQDIPQKAKVLDLGCSDGVWTKKLISMGYDVVAADINPEYQTAIKMDADEPFLFEDESFDLVWTMEVLEHLRKPQEAVLEMRRVLANGGRIILTTPNSYFWLFHPLIFFGKFFGRKMADFQNPDHKQFFSYGDIRKIFPNAEIYGFFPYFGPLRFTVIKPWLVSFFSPVFVVYDKK